MTRYDKAGNIIGSLAQGEANAQPGIATISSHGCLNDKQEFALEHVLYGCGNNDHYGQRAFADAYVRIGPVRLRAHLKADGSLVIDPSLQDRRLLVEIGIAFRKAVAERLCRDWLRRDQIERDSLERAS